MSVVEQQIDVMLAGIDADADADADPARGELRPRIVRIVQAFELTPDELAEAS
jgi:hypothetical protein